MPKSSDSWNRSSWASESDLPIGHGWDNWSKFVRNKMKKICSLLQHVFNFHFLQKAKSYCRSERITLPISKVNIIVRFIQHKGQLLLKMCLKAQNAYHLLSFKNFRKMIICKWYLENIWKPLRTYLFFPILSRLIMVIEIMLNDDWNAIRTKYLVNW